MNIGLITYDAAHRKTQDLLLRLSANSALKITLFALPFVTRKKVPAIFLHRPSWAAKIKPDVLGDIYSLPVIHSEAKDLDYHFKRNTIDFGIIGGAGLLPNDFVLNHKIANCHPGLLPYVRGLDSLKWAIHQKKSVGVTLHFIDNQADAGFLIARQDCPIYEHDTFHSFAYRQYEMEIDLLCQAPDFINKHSNFPKLSTTESQPTRRMPSKIEKNLLKDFELYKKQFAIPLNSN